MKTLDNILSKLQKLRKHPEPDLDVYADAAALLRMANEEAIKAGIDPVAVRSLVNPVNAIAFVRHIQAVIAPERYLTPCEVAEAFRVRSTAVFKWIRTKRLAATDVGEPGRPAYRIRRDALETFLPEKQTIYKTKHVKI